jgi:YHS domain-containing protein
MTTPTTYNPEVRRCYLCGTNTTLPRSADSFLLQTLKNGRSYNFCSDHWRKLLKVAPAEKIEEHRRKYLHEQDLQNNIHYSRLNKIIAELRRMNAINERRC